MDVLLIEPDADQVRHWQTLLSDLAHQADVAFDGKIGHSLSVHRRYDSILVHLPDPVAWVARIRSQGILVPVLVLLSPNSGVDIKSLSLPWVEYFHLPWNTDELVSRIQFLVDRRQLSINPEPQNKSNSGLLLF